MVFISFALTKETNQRKRAADVAEAKNRAFCLSPPKLAALKQRMTFNDKRLDFLYASSTKAGPSGELDGGILGEIFRRFPLISAVFRFVKNYSLFSNSFNLDGVMGD